MADNNTINEVKSINGISLCDRSLREKINIVLSELKKLDNSDHNHSDKYLSREEASLIFVSKTYVSNEISRFQKDFTLSDYITKTELNNKKYITKDYADNKYATKVYTDAKVKELETYIKNKLNELAALQRLNKIRILLNSLDLQLKELETNLPKLESDLNSTLNKNYAITTKFTGEIELSNKVTVVGAGKSYSTQISSTGSNYEFNTIKISMGGADITNSVLTSISTLRKQITIPKVTGNVIITASTKVSGYYITSSLPNCSSSNTATWVAANGNFSTRITANTNYKITNMTVTMSGTDITSQCFNRISDEVVELNIKNITGNVSIKATTELKTYTITYYTTNCSKTNSSTSIKAGKSYYAQIVANLNYTIANATVTMGGVNINNQCLSNTSTGGVEIDIESVTGNLVITVEATLDRYSISRSLTNCSASNSTTSIASGSAYYCVITPTTNYEINKYQLTMGGVNVTSQYVSKSGKTLIINIPSVTGTIVMSASAVQTTYPCTSITCNSTATIDINGSANLAVKVYPLNCTDSVSWDISDRSAIAVFKENGGYYARASKAGSYSVTFYCGSKSCTCRITVPQPKVYYNISYYLVGGVSSDTRQIVEKGKSYYTTITTTQSTLFFTSAKITMGGVDVTSQYLTMSNSKVVINIPSVTGDLYIDARTSDGWPVTYSARNGVSFAPMPSRASHKSLLEIRVYYDYEPNVVVVHNGETMYDKCLTYKTDHILISISQVVGPVQISAY